MKYSISIIFILMLGASAMTQPKKPVREEVFLHINRDYLLTGETLLYAAFVTQFGTSEPSSLSQILYVELVGPDNKRIFQQKVPLEKGRGASDFFIPTLISTGTYQLVAYTRWMKNFQNYFHTPITIVNPFEEYDIPHSTSSQVSVIPESQQAVINQPNNFVVKISKNYKPLSISGRLVNKSGEKQADILTDSTGLSNISFTPRAGEDYQVILENDLGEFEFFDVKIPFAETAISIDEYPGFYQFIVRSNNPSETLQIYNGESLILEREVMSNQSTQVSKKELILRGPYMARCRKALRVFDISETPVKNDFLGSFKTRSKVALPIQIEGNFSVSVTPINASNPSIGATSSINRLTNPNNSYQTTWMGSASLPDSVNYLPELRGEIISGEVDPFFAGQSVAFNTIDSVFQLRTALVEPNGHFNIQIDPMYANKKAFLTMLGSDTIVDFKVHSNYYEDYQDLTFPPVVLDSVDAAYLAQRSVYNQIENAYYEPEPIGLPSPLLPYQLGSNIKTYVLDDYNRFPKMYEHFIEFIPEVAARQNNSKSKIKVFLSYLLQMDLPPLILIDGLPTTAKNILSFSPYKIQSIDVSQNRIFLGPTVFDGMVSFHTFSNDLYGFRASDNSTRFDYQGLQPSKRYLYPEYPNADTHVADYRAQLYWNPSIDLEKGDSLVFYTSDLTGNFCVSVEGYDSDGKPISLKTTFEVTTGSPDAN